MKKRFVLGMLIVGLAIVCVACKGPVAGAPMASGEEVDVEPAPEPDIWFETEVESPDIDVLPEDEMVELSFEELEVFNFAFFNVYEDSELWFPASMANMFLLSEYETPLDIDMGMLLYNGIFGEDSIPVTSNEMSLLLERYGEEHGDEIFEYGDPIRMPVDSMNAVLKRYTGLTLEQTNKVGLTRYYLEEYQSYYGFASDFAYSEIEVTDGWKNAQGTVVLRYIHPCRQLGEIWYVILHEENGQYYFSANIRITP